MTRPERPLTISAWMRWVEQYLRRLDMRIVNKPLGDPGGGSTPTGAASGELSGFYPGPSIADNVIDSANIINGSIVDADVNVLNKDGLPSVYSMRTLGGGIQQAAAGDHTHAGGGTGDGTGVIKSWKAVAPSTYDIPATITPVDIPGCTVTVPVTAPDEVFLVIGTGDVTRLVLGATGVISLNVGGVIQTEQILAQDPTVGMRHTLHQSWRVTGLTPGNVVFKFQGNMSNASGGRITVNPSHTLFQVISLTATAEAGSVSPGDLGETFVQGTPATVWTINHALAFQPNVAVIDSAGDQVEGDVKYIDADTITLTFTAAFSGTAYLS